MRRTPSQTQSVIMGQLQIGTRIDCPSPLRNEKYVGEWTDDVQRGIERRTIDYGAIIHSVPPEIDEERGALSYRTADIADVLLKEKWSLLLRIGIPRIPEVVRDIEAFGAVVSIRSGLCEDLDPPGADLVIFRRKRVLIDADLANRLLRRYLAIGKTVDENRSAARPCARTGNRDEIGDQIVGVIRKRLEIVAG